MDSNQGLGSVLDKQLQEGRLKMITEGMRLSWVDRKEDSETPVSYFPPWDLATLPGQ
jgi:hypothetical protein